jgi:hypothetical protein
MSAEVLPFPNRQSPKRRVRSPSAPALVRTIRRMLKFNLMLMPHPEIKHWLSAKNITIMQVISTIKQGEPIGPPIIDRNGDREITLKRVAAGRRTQVTTAVKADHFVIVNIS